MHNWIKRTAAACLVVGALAMASAAAAQIAFGNEAGGARSMPVMSYRDIPFRTVVRQQFDYSCGSAALATLLSFHYGLKVSEAEAFRAMYDAGDKQRIRKQGFSLLDMKTYLKERGLTSDGFRLTWEKLSAVTSPSIAMVTVGSYRHFVVIKGISRTDVLVGDPASGLKTYPRADFEKIWNGVVFYIRDARTAPLFNARAEWEPYQPAPWALAKSSSSLIEGLSRELPPIYQISPVFSINSVTP